MKLKDLLTQAKAKLKAANIDSAEIDARLLLQYSINFSHEKLFLYPDYYLLDGDIDQYMQLIERRINREPVAKIIGSKSFWKSDFIVNKHTLDPRPDSEVIINAALDMFYNKDMDYRFLDLGCGTGCLLFSLLQEYSQATGVATDISSEALKVAKINMELLGLENRAELLEQNWADSLTEKFDLIISNPPYIPRNDINNLQPEVKNYDPMLALDGGIDGLDPYRYLAKQIILLLKPKAYAILEFGIGQSESIKDIFVKHGYIIENILLDLAGLERAIIVKANI